MPRFDFDKVKNFQLAVDKALADLEILNPVFVARNAMVDYDHESKTYAVPVLGQVYRADLLSKCLHHPDIGNEHVRGSMTVLLLHYLIHARPKMLMNRLISYRELPDGMVFYNAFRNLAIAPIAHTFGEDLEAFGKSASRIAGQKVDHGGIAYQFMMFPRLPVTYILWGGDDEIPAAANVLFDHSAKEQLPTEDLAEVGEVITHHLVHRRIS